MTTKPQILWRWKGKGKFTRGRVGGESSRLILISDEWYMKADIDIKGYEEQVTR